MRDARQGVGLLVVSSCGTSLLTNGADAAMRQLLLATADRREGELAPAERRAIEERLAAVRADLAGADEAQAGRAAAELDALLALAAEAPATVQPVQHLLIHTDTFQGAAVAAALARWLETRGAAVTLRGVAGWRLADPLALRLALADLARGLADALPGWRQAGWRIVFNLTGGFKAVQGFLQTLGSILADEVVYVFEGGGRLLHVPRLPIRFALEAPLEGAVELFRRLAAGYPVPAAAAAGLPETLVLEIDGEAVLSEWGHAAWAAVRDRFYGEAVLSPSPSGSRSDRASPAPPRPCRRHGAPSSTAASTSSRPCSTARPAIPRASVSSRCPASRSTVPPTSSTPGPTRTPAAASAISKVSPAGSSSTAWASISDAGNRRYAFGVYRACARRGHALHISGSQNGSQWSIGRCCLANNLLKRLVRPQGLEP